MYTSGRWRRDFPGIFLPFGEGVFGDGEGMLAALREDGTGFAKAADTMRGGGIMPPEIVLAANTPRTVIRAVKLSEPGKRLTPEMKWGMVQGAFPLGSAINGESHVFDGCVFSREGEALYFMAALPVEAADAITRFGAVLAGNMRKLARLETVEHVVFRRFCEQDIHGNVTGAQWLVFPQASGLRVLVTENRLPKATHYLPVLPEIRRGALLRAVRADAPESVILLTRPDWGEAYDWPGGFQWVRDFFADGDTAVGIAGF
jgi:hypothetical protein